MSIDYQLKEVAKYLDQKAQNESLTSGERELFGRSAYNRFYYSLLPASQKLIRRVSPNWNAKHSQYPDMIKNSVKKAFKKEEKKAQNIGDGKGVALCQTAYHAINELAIIMESSYSIRCVADYEFDKSLVFGNGGSYSLEGVQISDAYQWPRRAEMYIKTINECWRKINGA